VAVNDTVVIQKTSCDGFPDPAKIVEAVRNAVEDEVTAPD